MRDQELSCDIKHETCKRVLDHLLLNEATAVKVSGKLSRHSCLDKDHFVRYSIQRTSPVRRDHVL